MGTKVTEFLKIMDPYNAFPSEEFGVNNKYTDIYRGWKPLPPVSNELWERLSAAIKFMIVHNEFVIAG
jgi:hypothetical protein